MAKGNGVTDTSRDGSRDHVTSSRDAHADAQARYRERKKNREQELEIENADLKKLVADLQAEIARTRGTARIEREDALERVTRGDLRPVAQPEYDAFEMFWQAYPKRSGENPKKPAREKFERAVAKGVDPEDIIAGARRYARQSIDTEPQYIPMAKTWLNQERWKDEDFVQERNKSYRELAEELRNGTVNEDDLFGPELSGPGHGRRY